MSASERDGAVEDVLRAALDDLWRHGYQPMYNGRPSCPFCHNFVDDEETHTAGCILRAAREERTDPDLQNVLDLLDEALRHAVQTPTTNPPGTKGLAGQAFTTWLNADRVELAAQRLRAALRSSAAGLDVDDVERWAHALHRYKHGFDWDDQPTPYSKDTLRHIPRLYQDEARKLLAEYARLPAPQAAPKTQEEAGG